MPAYSTDVQLIGGQLVQKYNTVEEKQAAWAAYLNKVSLTRASTLNRTQPSLYDITRTVSAEGTMVPLVYGAAQVGGRVFCLDYNSSNKTWVVGYVIAMGEIQGYTNVWIDGAAKKSGVTVTEYTGTTTQTVDSDLSGAIAGFNDNMVITHPEGNYGVAYLVVKYTDAHYQGFPDVVAEIQGKKVWNPKTSTTIYSANPALHLGDFLNSNVYGMGKTVDDTTLEAVQDYCDDQTGIVPAENRRISYQVIDKPRPVEDWASVLAMYASCFTIYRGDTVYLLADKAIASTRTITEDDIVQGSLVITKQDPSNLPTVIYGIYTDTTNSVWQEKTCTPAKISGVDAGTVPFREQRINLVGVNRHSQAVREVTERLDKLWLGNLHVAFQMHDEGLELEIGDRIVVTHGMGLTSQDLRIIQDPEEVLPGRWNIVATEYDANAYDDTVDAGTAYNLGSIPTSITPAPPTAVTATAVTYQLDNNQYSSRLDITWTAPADSSITGYNVVVKDGSSNVIWSASTTETETSTSPLIEGVTYTVEVSSFNTLASSAVASDTETINGYTTPPNAPASLSGSNNDSQVHLYWPASTSSNASLYEIRYYTTAQAWADGTVLEQVNGLNFTTQQVAAGTWRFGVRTISSTGVYSTTEAEQDIVVAAGITGATTYYHTDWVAANAIGDLLYRTDQNNHPYRANTAGSATSGAWTSIRDTSNDYAITGIQSGTSFNAVDGGVYPIDASSNAVTMNLPATPNQNDRITFMEYDGSWGDNTVTVSPNGTDKIMGSNEDMICDQSNFNGSLVYIDSTVGWIIAS